MVLHYKGRKEMRGLKVVQVIEGPQVQTVLMVSMVLLGHKVLKGILG